MSRRSEQYDTRFDVKLDSTTRDQVINTPALAITSFETNVTKNGHLRKMLLVYINDWC